MQTRQARLAQDVDYEHMRHSAHTSEGYPRMNNITLPRSKKPLAYLSISKLELYYFKFMCAIRDAVNSVALH